MHPATRSSETPRKVVLIGNASVGKTSIASRWVNAAVFCSSPAATVGPSNFVKEVFLRGKSFKISLWDTAGQEQFRSIAPIYLRGAHTAVLVCSIVSLESFDAIPHWIDLLLSVNESPIPIICAVNKMDLDPGTDKTPFQRLEPHKSKFIEVFYVSAARGEGLNTLFEAMAEASYQGRSADGSDIAEPQFLIDEEKACC